jgi:hypothetical protein
MISVKRNCHALHLDARKNMAHKAESVVLLMDAREHAIPTSLSVHQSMVIIIITDLHAIA